MKKQRKKLNQKEKVMLKKLNKRSFLIGALLVLVAVLLMGHSRTKKLIVLSTSEFRGAVTVGSNIISDTDGTDDLGSTTIRWDQVYTDELFWNKGADVASAATGFSLGADGNYYDITGTTGIDSIIAQVVGKIVALQFDGILTMTDGGNLKMHGNFVTAAEATIVFQSDGTDWYELSRAGGNLIVQGTSTLTGAQTLTGVTTHSGNVVSDTDGTDDLGTNTTRWNALYVDELFWQKGSDVASAADNFALGADGNYYDITGTTGLDSIAAQTAGKMVLLQFDGTLTVTDGGNLKLAGNFSATADDILILVTDGTDWFESSRSNN